MKRRKQIKTNKGHYYKKKVKIKATQGGSISSRKAGKK